MRWPSVLDEPAVANPPKRVWRDWVLAGVVVLLTLVTTGVSGNQVAREAEFVATLVVVPLLFWRRTHPWLTTLVAVVAFLLADHYINPVEDMAVDLTAHPFVLVFPYAAFRWGSGWTMVKVLGLLTVAWLVGAQAQQAATTEPSWDYFVFYAIYLLVPVVLGLAMRFRGLAEERAIDAARSREREDLARELHDSVAHHVSAIVIQAQAGQSVAGVDPAAAQTALADIESCAARALTDMRSLVGSLRSSADRRPAPGIDDIPQLASVPTPEGIEVTVTGCSDSANAPVPVQAAAYRICQESITNALRHARDVTNVSVSVAATADSVEVDVTNDGRLAGDVSSQGFGLIGMAERATQLGGWCHAGPMSGGGWQVRASLPIGDKRSRDAAPNKPVVTRG